MATLQHPSTAHPHHRHRRHSLDYSSLPSSLRAPTFSLPTTSASTAASSASTAIAAAISAASTAVTSATASSFSLDSLEEHLASGNFRQADEETRRLLIVLAGEGAVKRGYVFFSEVQFIPKEELQAIDELWRKYSDNRFGYSVQRKIWVNGNRDFTRFFLKVGWMKKLDTEVEQYNYRSFPNEFMWEVDNGNGGVVPPEGHLPLTNALRGTQLLGCILSHPAFDDDGGGEDEKVDDEAVVGDDEEGDKKKSRPASFRDRLFKPNYTF